jgi:hypothetical protein
MGIYARMKREIRKEEEDLKAMRGQELSDREKACVTETKALMAEIGVLDAAGTVQRGENEQWFIAVGHEFHFTKRPGYGVHVTMQPTVCTKGCADYIATKEEFLDFMRNHLSHKDHEPTEASPGREF